MNYMTFMSLNCVKLPICIHYGPEDYCYSELQFMQCVSVLLLFFSNPLIEKSMANTWKEENETATSLPFPFPAVWMLYSWLAAPSRVSFIYHSLSLQYCTLACGDVTPVYDVNRCLVCIIWVWNKNQAKRKIFSAGISDYI